MASAPHSIAYSEVLSVVSPFSHSVSRSVVSNSVIPWTITHQAPVYVGFPRQNTRDGCHFLLQGIFLTQGLNPSLLHFRQILYYLAIRETK